MNKATPVAVAGLSALALVAGGAITTSSPSVAGTGDGKVPVQRSAAAAPGDVTSCNGGAAVGLQTRLSAVPFAFAGTSNAPVAVPGAKVTVKGPKKGKDTFLVTFSAETYYAGSGWMSLQVHNGGVPIAPFANNGSPFAFASESNYQSNSAQFCVRLGKGQHPLSVQALTTGDAGESGWLDDWTLSIQRFD